MAVDLPFFRSETSQRLRAEGRAESRAEDILLVLDQRGVELTDADRARIATCHDLTLLGAWFARSITAATTAELFADEAAQADEAPQGEVTSSESPHT